MRLAFLALIAIAAVLILPMVNASYITMSVRSSGLDVSSGSGTLVVELENKGDEPAHSVQVSLFSPTNSFSSKPFTIELLANGQKVNATLNVKSESALQGTHHAVLVVDYADANAYRFSAISPVLVQNGQPSVSMLQSQVSEATIGESESGKVTVSMRNLADAPVNARVSLVLPREVKCTQCVSQVALDAKSQSDISFDVSSFGALAGSTYTIIAITEYSDGTTMYSSASKGRIIVSKAHDFFSSWAFYAIILLVVIAATAIGFTHLKRKGVIK